MAVTEASAGANASVPSDDTDTDTDTDTEFRAEVRSWLSAHLVGEFAALGTGNDLGGPAELGVRRRWERELAAGGWIGTAWPRQFGGRDLSLWQQLVFNEEYARANGPIRVGFFGEQLLGPTVMAFGTDEQRARFLPPILRAEEFWCQGFSEPEAGSDLANVKTAAVLDGDEWVITGQKVWTSLAHLADWIFVLARTDPGAPKHRGLSFLLCPMNQPGVEIRPIRQITGTAEFNEVFLDGARTRADLVVGGVGNGWKVVNGTLGFERGTAFLGQQLRFAAEYWRLVDVARDRGVDRDPVLRDRLADAYVGLEVMRQTGMRAIGRALAGKPPGPEASTGKLQWSRWHQRLGELATDVLGPQAMVTGGDSATGGDAREELLYSFLFSRSHTIYAGSSEVQRNIIGERVLGLPREPSGAPRASDR
ncbi:acyl-CoA dehydrogenase family protein [Frankia sp. Cppng1_Ct_nod]|uniref:acyl-CoA dehydrogenase family protein n=1 Tax=Frankia sp. Cppng1_Ct_nod TaxID=2897162 RepID=UPI001041B8BB|nr:acyl-CoA dehydrogenase family protein [Frankia sp. Cppng1_Ct_nod]